MNRDRRRLATVEQRRDVYLRAKGRCQKCRKPLGDDWQAAHLIAWSNGGPTTNENLEAWCQECNLKQGTKNAALPPELVLRPWQEEALPLVLDLVFRDGIATVSAAPGAGKTIFAGVVFKILEGAGFVERMIVVVPNSNLRRQWTDSLSNNLLINLDWDPRDGWQEYRGTLGAVVTYQSLPNTATAHLHELSERGTMVVFDEVHHIGDAKAWGYAVKKMIGDVSRTSPHSAAVLNMTGTLFRSSDKERICTVRYQPVQDNPEQIEAIADFTIFTRDLVPHTLRPPYVYIYGSQVQLLDMDTSEIIEGDIAELDPKLRSVALRESFKRDSYIRGFVKESLRLLQVQQSAIGHDHKLKILCVCATMEQAGLYADVYNEVTNRHFARLVTSEDSAADRILRRAARENENLAIVSVRMVTEGFDCAAVSTIAYASNIVAQLSVAQTMARAMRLTSFEQQTGKVLPAQILIHDDQKLKDAFRRALGAQMHILNAEERKPREREGGEGLGELFPRYQVLDLTDPVLRGTDVVAVEEGEATAEELEITRSEVIAAGIPEVYTPAAVIVFRKLLPKFPRIYTRPEPTTIRPADPRTLNKAYREQLKTPRGWMAKHVDHDDRYVSIGMFVGLSHDSAGIEPNGLDQASVEQLMMVRAWMIDRIREHCLRYHEDLPGFASQDGE